MLESCTISCYNFHTDTPPQTEGFYSREEVKPMFENLVSIFATLLLSITGNTPTLPTDVSNDVTIEAVASVDESDKSELDAFEVVEGVNESPVFDRKTEKLMQAEIKAEKQKQIEEEGMASETESQGSSEGESLNSGLGEDGVASNEPEQESAEPKATEAETENEDLEKQPEVKVNSNNEISVPGVTEVNLNKTVKSVTGFSLD